MITSQEAERWLKRDEIVEKVMELLHGRNTQDSLVTIKALEKRILEESTINHPDPVKGE